MCIRPRQLGPVFAFWAVLLVSPHARVQEAEQAGVIDRCLASHEGAQRLRKGGKLIEARDALMVCSREACPDIAKSDCTRWLAEVRQDVPSIVLGARFGDGRDAIDVKALIDGKPLQDKLDGRAVEVDPGIHTIRFETSGREPVEERVSVRVGERNRRVIVMFRDPVPAAPPPKEPDEGVPTMTYVLGGVGILGLAGFGYFGATGLSKESDLDQCKPICASNDVDGVRTRYLAADISLAVGLVALGGASYFYFTKDDQQERGPVGVRVGAGHQGLNAAVTGQF